MTDPAPGATWGEGERFWAIIDRRIEALPAALSRRARLLRQDASLRLVWEERGPPQLLAPSWVLDDLSQIDPRARASFEPAVLASAFYAWATIHLTEQRDPGPSAWLLSAAAGDLAMHLPADRGFWGRFRSGWEVFTETTAALEDPRYGVTEDDLWMIQKGRSGPLALGPLAVTTWARAEIDTNKFSDLLDRLWFVEAVATDLRQMKRLLDQGVVVPTLRRMLGGLGIDPAAPRRPEELIGEIMLGNAIGPVVANCQAQLASAGRTALSLGLPSFAAYTQSLAQRLPPSAGTPRRMVKTRHSASPASDSVGSARAFLMADPALREAWEVHRWGLLGTIETTANFAAGLIIEILARANNAVTGMVDRFFESVAAKDLAYYDHPSGRAYIESDTLGLLLRLHPNSSRTTGQRDVLDDYLQLLLRHVKDDGSFPVWLIDDPNTTAVVMGEGCGTIEANLLRGLLTSGGPKHLPWAVAAAGRLLARYAELGVGINVNYPRSFALGVLAELLDDLGRVGPPAVMPLVRDAQVRVRVEIEQVSTRSRPSPQDAACLLWACARPWLSDLPQPSWRQTVLSAQLFDGGWPAEAIFFAPGPGGRTQWHSSRLVTTALCYQALLLA